LVKDASGNVGVGTASPTSRLQVGDATVNTSNGIILGKYNAASEANLPAIRQISAGTGNDLAIAATSTSGAIRFYTGGANSSLDLGTAGNAERMRIDSSGNLLVGTTSALGSEQVYFISASASKDVLVVNNTVSSGTGERLIRGRANGSDRFYVLTNGNVQNTNNSYGAISDIKLKENVVDATPKLEKLNQVRIVNYNLIGDEQKQLGVIAQEVEQLFPSMIDESPDRDAEGNNLGTKTKSVKYSVFVPMLIKAIQELKAIVDAQAVRIAALES
jgi:hypothetical protein